MEILTASELINLMIPPLKLSDDASKALVWMDELRINMLPVVDNQSFKGFVIYDDLLDLNNSEVLIENANKDLEKCFVNESQHFFDILKVANDYDAEMVAVVDDLQLYKGIIPISDLLNVFAQTSSVQNPGAIIVLSLKQIDYSLSEISRLIESDNVQILSVHTSGDPIDPTKLKLTLKLNQTDVSRVIGTLERFNYKIINKFQDFTSIDSSSERLDILMKYLDI